VAGNPARLLKKIECRAANDFYGSLGKEAPSPNTM